MKIISKTGLRQEDPQNSKLKDKGIKIFALFMLNYVLN